MFPLPANKIRLEYLEYEQVGEFTMLDHLMFQTRLDKHKAH